MSKNQIQLSMGVESERADTNELSMGVEGERADTNEVRCK